ncbi:MAG: trypsin-like peptidase domain-containing protein [Saprospiraceae bacterium]
MASFLRTALLCVISALLAVGVWQYLEGEKPARNDGNNARLTAFEGPFFKLPKGRTVDPATLYPNFVNASSKVTPAVVNIKSLSGGGLNDIWSRERSIDASSGSGVIISSDGYIVTNNHVVEGGTEIEVTLDDRREYEAELIGRDPSTDLALVKIEAQGLPFVSFGNSDSLFVGEWVLAVGNPFDLRSTVTAGIVSAKGRSIDILDDRYSIESFIQTDAAVNPGNSGGALVNSGGELMGINTAIITRSGRYEGYSFAVPSSLAEKVIDDLKEFGTVQRALLGIDFENVDAKDVASLGLPTNDGVLIREINPNSGAADAGLEPGDVIIRIEDAPIRDIPALKENIGRFRPGATVRITYFRDSRLSTVRVTLKNAINDVSLVTQEHQSFMREIGFELRDLSEDEISRMPSQGAKVISIYLGSKVDRTRMDPDYIITKVNRERVKTVDDLVRIITATRKGEDVLLEGYYESFNGEYYYAFKR